MTDLTILLTLKDRVEFTYRWLQYAERHLTGYKIIIADGGKNKEIEKLLQAKEKENLNYRYIRFTYDKTYEDYYKKINDAVKLVDTEYCILADNDDFYLKNSIDKSVNFLKINLEYSTCRGQLALLHFHKQKNSKKIKLRYTLARHVNEEKDRSSERVNAFFMSQHVGPTWYDVHRTNNIKKNIERFYYLKFKEYNSFEKMITLSDFVDGKIFRTNEIYCIRQAPDSNSSHNIFISQVGSTLNRFKNGDLTEDSEKITKIISQDVSKKEKLDSKKIYNDLNIKFLEYIKFRIKNESKPITKNHNNFFLKLFNKFVFIYNKYLNNEQENIIKKNLGIKLVNNFLINYINKN